MVSLQELICHYFVSNPLKYLEKFTNLMNFAKQCEQIARELNKKGI